MVRAFAADELVDGRISRTVRPPLRPFLQHGLGIAHVVAERRECLCPITFDEGAGDLEAAVDIKCRNHRFANSREDGAFAPPSACRFRSGQNDMVGQSCVICGGGASFTAGQRIEFERQCAFRRVRIEIVQLLGDREPQHTVAQEFQPLVGCFGTGARMRQRTVQQSRIPEDITTERSFECVS